MSETGPPRPRPLRPFSPEPTAHRPRYSHTPAARSFSCTVFTFGQTGSGKTYTLTGPPPQVGRALAKPPGARDPWASEKPWGAQTPRGKGIGRGSPARLFAGKERSGKVKDLGQSSAPGFRCPLYLLALRFSICEMDESTDRGLREMWVWELGTVLFPLAAAKSFQSCPTLCDPIDGSPPGSALTGILQARTLEWVAISFSNA